MLWLDGFSGTIFAQVCKSDAVMRHKTLFKIIQFVFSQLFTLCILTKNKQKVVGNLQPHYGVISFWNHSFKRFKVMGVSTFLIFAIVENTRTIYDLCSKLTIKTPERNQWCVLLSSLLTLNKFYTLQNFKLWRL